VLDFASHRCLFRCSRRSSACGRCRTPFVGPALLPGCRLPPAAGAPFPSHRSPVDSELTKSDGRVPLARPVPVRLWVFSLRPLSCAVRGPGTPAGLPSATRSWGALAFPSLTCRQRVGQVRWKGATGTPRASAPLGLQPVAVAVRRSWVPISQPFIRPQDGCRSSRALQCSAHAVAFLASTRTFLQSAKPTGALTR